MPEKTTTDTVHNNNTKNNDNINAQLLVLYKICTGLCIFMIIWVCVVPGTWLHDHSTFHSTTLLSIMIQNTPDMVPPNVVTKYRGHYLVHCLHFLPGAIWCACIPFQLHSTFRRHYRTLHVRIGYVFLTTVLLTALGVGVILKRNLSLEHFYQDVSTVSQRLVAKSITIIGTIWFVGTAMYAIIYCARNNKNILQHQIWIIRHVSSGLWIAIQRLLIGIYPYTIYYNVPVTRVVQREAFTSAIRNGYIISILLGEYAIYLLRQQQKQKQTKKEE